MKTILNRRNFFAVVVSVAVLGLSAGVAKCGTYGGGSGTAGEPYLIYTAEQMNAIGANPGDSDKHFKLMADIDLSNFDGQQGRPAFNIIGVSGGSPFTGAFDGNCHTISNFTYISTATNNIGIFGWVNTGEIKNLGLIDPNVDAGTSWCNSVGSLVGIMINGTIIGCYAEGGSISGWTMVGGLVGDNINGKISNCYATGNVSGDSWVGGLVGWNEVDNYSGGEPSTISNSTSSATVIANTEVGGLVGLNWADIINCYATGSVSGDKHVGGLVGLNVNPSLDGVIYNNGNISKCYSMGSVSGNYYIGGLIGRKYRGTVTASFWDTQTSGRTWSAGGSGKTTAQMQMAATFIDAGWDFITPVWKMCDGPPDYPRLWWEVCPVRYVDAVNGDDDNDGLSPEAAFATIQKGIDSAFDGDTVLVADGTYTGEGNRDIDFKGKAITVRSTDPNDPNVVAATIIDCNGTLSDNHQGFRFDSGEDFNSVLSGLTITNGFAYSGGGICITRDSNPTIISCNIMFNTAYGGKGAHGGGIYCEYSSPRVINCTLSNNEAFDGGGLGSYTSSLSVINCTISGNIAHHGGGGLATLDPYDAVSYPMVLNCRVTGNSAHFGGGLFNSSCLTVSNCTFSQNSAEYGGGLYSYRSGPNLSNSIFWGNIDGDGVDESAQIHTEDQPAIVNYCCIQGLTGGLGGTGNVGADPCFVGLANEDYHLLEESPCIDAGDPNYPYDPDETDIDGLPRIIGACVDMGVYEFNHIPVADAGEDREIYAWIDGMVEVVLDGTGSYDDDGHPLSYVWSWTIDGEIYTAEGVSPTIELPVGEHIIELIVNDGIDDSEPDEVVITVVPPIEVTMGFTPQALNPGSRGKWVKAHFVLAEGFGVDDVDVNTPATVEPFGIESDYINVFINEDGLVEIEIAFDRAAFCGAAIDDSVTDITVVGRLTNGEYFYGTDTIRIINNNLRYLAVFAFYWLEGDCGAPDWCSGVDLNQNSAVDFVDFALFDGCCIEVIKE